MAPAGRPHPSARGIRIVKAVGYTCVNTLSQQPKNLSLDVQQRIIRGYVDAHGWKLGRIYRETLPTGKGADQPKLDEIIAASGKGGFDVLVVARLDRLTRNIRKLNTLVSTVCMENGVGLVSIEEGLDTFSDSGRLVLKIIDIVTKWDNKRISDRTREIIARKRAKGERVGHAPFGFTYRDKQLVPVEDEMRIVRLICEQREKGVSYHRIARMLNEGNIASKRGGVWYAETVKTVYQHALAGEALADEA